MKKFYKLGARCCILQHLIWVCTVCLGLSVRILRVNKALYQNFMKELLEQEYNQEREYRAVVKE